MGPKRLTRREQQAHTRTRLMSAASTVFARRGLERASIDEVAEEAGFTKGAFYANFKNKQDLFLAMLDERFAARLAEIEAAAGSDADPPEQAEQAAREFIQAVAADDEWERLFFEFSAYAMRNGDFREELVSRYRTIRAQVAEIFSRRLAEIDLEPPIPVEEMAVMTVAMANGIALERMLEPEVVSEDLYATMLGTFFTGVGALAGRFPDEVPRS